MSNYLKKSLFCLLIIVMPCMNLASKAMFNNDRYDLNGNITVRALQQVNDNDLSFHITAIIAPSVFSVNLVDQWLITDASLTFLENTCPNLKCLNIQNTQVTRQGRDNFLNHFPNMTIYHH